MDGEEELDSVPAATRVSPPAEQEVCVRAAVGLQQAAGESWAAGSGDPLQLLLAEREIQPSVSSPSFALHWSYWGKLNIFTFIPSCQESCLTADDIFHLDAGQEKVLELARPQLALLPLGYSVSLVLWDPNGPGTQLPLQDIIWQVINTVFQELEVSGSNVQRLQTVSLVQVCAEGEAWDLLRPDGQALHMMDITPLGLMVEEAMEVAVSNAQNAISIYTWGLGAAPAAGPSATQGACSLFTLTVEQQLEGGRHQRSALRILASSGACPELVPHPVLHAPSTGALPWIVERLLEGNSLTFLLLCVTLPGTPGEQIRAALALAEQVKGVNKSVSPTHWDPAWEVAARREKIRGLRTELQEAAGRPEQHRVLVQLQRALRELQVLKSQRWEKKQAVTRAFGTNQVQQPSAKDLISAGNAAPTQQPRTQMTPDGTSMELAGALEPSKSCKAGTSQAPRSAGQGLMDEPWALTGGHTAGKQHEPCLSAEVGYSLANDQRQQLQARHQLLLQQELQDKAASDQEQDAAHLQQEMAMLHLSLEAACREREAAKQHLEALLQGHRQEMQAWRQHLQQALQDQRRQGEERAEALKQRYQALLQEVLRDAVELSTHNQELQEARRHSSANATTQTS
eukprot:XP_025010705.1 uncharacterized protein LOC107054473 isoform X3 [Gallus gallus]